VLKPFTPTAPGFTLIEVLIVLVIAVVMLMMVGPNVAVWIADSRIRRVARRPGRSHQA
jgi:prepilin-type N-terminal cleavage/methylation domain-containing protein